MTRRRYSVLVGLAATALAVPTVNPPAGATPLVTSSPDEPALAGSEQRDDLPSPLADKRTALREKAVARLVKGTARVENRNGQPVIKVGGQYVEYGISREESIFTILVEFGDQIHPTYGGTPGPLHNQIPKPDRDWDGGPTDDNSTYWEPDFNRAHYRDLMFGEGESFRDFYLKQSNGRFLAKGDVSDWVKVPYNEARYGYGRGGSSTYWPFVRDTAQAWYDAQVAAGKTPDQIKAELATFDKWDRYDYNNNGNFNEPDGYIDHFQAIHAGEGEEAGGGAQGTDAIWSHRWYAYSNGVGTTGPSFNRLGGAPIGDSGIWIGDYTTEPENGGLGVFTHEFGHDLGLPDLYDTAGGDNGTGFWTLMSGGSWLNHGTDSIGTTPGYMGPWEKLFLGWLDYQKVSYGTNTQVKLGPADRAGKMPQAVLVTLPDKTVTDTYNTPYSGSSQWWGGSADGLNTTLTRSVDLTGATTASLTTKAWYDIEAGYDYLYGQVSTDGGSTWTDAGAPVDGSSNGQWVDLTYDLTPYAGKSVLFRFRYSTDGGVHYAGAFLDDLALSVDGTRVWFDDVETADPAWTANGFTRMGGSVSRTAPHYYLAENRVYSGYDSTLRTGPYNFGWASTRPDWVERFPYQNGLLVWYADGAYEDNNTSEHPGHGEALPVDARPAPVTFPDGRMLGNRRQVFDATFGREATDPVTFHRNGVPAEVPSRPAIPTFDDSDPMRYWSAKNPMSSVQVGGTGTKLTVVDSGKQTDQMIVNVTFN